MTSIPVIPSFSSGAILTAAQLNQLAAAVSFWANPPACYVYRSAAITFSNNVYQTIAWDAEQFDTDNMHDVSTNNSRVTATATGTYEISGAVAWGSNSSGQRGLQLRQNAAGNPAGGVAFIQTFQNASTASVSYCLIPTTTYQLTAGDYVELFASQNSGAVLAGNPGFGLMFMSMRLVGI